MKQMKYIAILLSFLLLCACNKEEVINHVNSGNIALKLNVLNSVPEKKTRGTDAIPELKESTISNVYIFFYEDGAAGTEKPVYFYEATGMSASGSWEKTFIQSLTDLVNGTDYEVFALANIPLEKVSAPTKEITKDELLALTEDIATNRATDGSDISFSGKSLFKCGTDSEVQIDLKRTVARLDITINKSAELGADWTIQAVEVSNENTNTLYFTDVVKNGTGRTLDNGQAWKVGDSNLYRYYTYENESTISKADQLFLLITLKNDKTSETKIYKVVVNNAGNSQVERNYIYKVTLTLKNTPPEPLDVAWTIVPFNEVNIDGSVQATYLNLNKAVIPVMNIYEGILSIQTDAPIVHVDLSNIGGFALSSYEYKTEVDIPVDDSGELELKFHLNSTDRIIPDGTVIISAGNLKKSITLKKEESSVLLSHVSARMTGDTELITNGTVLPWHVYKDSYDGMTGQLNLTVERNSTWYYVLYTYDSEGTQIEHKGLTYKYNGIPGEETVQITLDPNDYEGYGVMTVHLTVGYDHSSFDLPVYTLVFTINEYNK